MAEEVWEEGARVGGMANAAVVVGFRGRRGEKHEISSIRATAS